MKTCVGNAEDGASKNFIASLDCVARDYVTSAVRDLFNLPAEN